MKPGPWPCALICTSALIGPPVRAALAAIAARSSGSKLPALAPAGKALPSFHSTASGLMSQMTAARFFSSSTTFCAAWVTAMPPAKVTRLPPVEALKPIAVVSPTTGRTLSNGTPSTSATIIAIEAREPPMSGWPSVTVTVPSSLTWQAALDSPPALCQ